MEACDYLKLQSIVTIWDRVCNLNLMNLRMKSRGIEQIFNKVLYILVVMLFS